MIEFGHLSLIAAWQFALVGIVVGLLARNGNRPALTAITARLVIATALTALTSLIVLGFAFVNDDYRLQYVWQYSNREMLTLYKVTAIWGGMDGSMLLWAAVLAISGGIVAMRWKLYPRALIPSVLAVVSSSNLFFLSVVVFFTNPFRYIGSDIVPAIGNGLNPLLQNPYMAIHPPMLYLGFTTFSIPYAFCMGALLSNQLSNEWIRLTRRWTLIAWGFLTCGIVLGGHWAYIELGWGGFWAWDPVENASFFPWLTGTAFLHSVMVQERKNMLKVWNVILIVLTYGLTVFGTFLTRSGVVQSVHAFAETDIGWIFLVYLSFLALFATALLLLRKKDLKAEKRIESLFSREAAFLLNNLILLSICFTTIWGVMFPVLSEAVTGKKQAVGIPYFNAVNIPLFLALIFLMGIGPLIAWRKASFTQLRKTFLTPFLFSLAIAALLVYCGIVTFYPVLSYALCTFVVLTVMGEIHRGYLAEKKKAAGGSLTTLARRHQSRYGGYLVHLGVTVMTISITASMAHKMEREFSLSTGEREEFGRFSLELNEVGEHQGPNYTALTAKVFLRDLKTDKLLEELSPELRHYNQNRENTSEVALRMGLREDVYLVLAGLDDSGNRVTFKAFINPLQVWLWFGTLIVLAGTGVVLLPQRKSKMATIGMGEPKPASVVPTTNSKPSLNPTPV
jgi:cytochrome c-type biogenesis protein CcmF